MINKTHKSTFVVSVFDCLKRFVISKRFQKEVKFEISENQNVEIKTLKTKCAQRYSMLVIERKENYKHY